MRNIIIGTAGHIDHGKTLLIKALTGIDTDRLKEEKKRGITIELGFAYLDLDDGARAGIIDVPGHERFIKNMLAGAGGIDLALLVVAADDGVMPQTREHLGILRLLDIRDGLIVVTKKDLADAQWLELVIEDVKEAVRGSFLETARIHAVSSYTGEGIDALRRSINALAKHVGAKNTQAPFRLPIDRVFTMDGFGTVVTGTLIEGSLCEGAEAELFPSCRRVRVRGIQVHGDRVACAFAGQRAAVNLAGVKRESVSRGDTLAAPKSMTPAAMLDVRLKILEDGGRGIRSGSRLHFYHGARDLLCRLTLLECDSLAPGQEGYAQLRFTQAVAAKAGDRFVLRFYSPIETVGGGVVLDATPKKHRRGQQRVVDALRIREGGSNGERVLQAVADGAPRFAKLGEARDAAGLSPQEFTRELFALTQAGRVWMLFEDVYIDHCLHDKLRQRLEAALADFHAANPLLAGMRRDELRARLCPGQKPALCDRLIGLFTEEGFVCERETRLALVGFEITLTEADKRLMSAVDFIYKESGYAPPDVSEVLARFPKEKAALVKVLEAMLSDGRLIMGSKECYFHPDTVANAEQKLRAYLAEHSQIALGAFRDLADASRKYALALLDHFDRAGITKKAGDTRTLCEKK